MMIGEKFGKLLVISENPKRTLSREKRYDCQCSCGNAVIVRGSSLRGGTSSCGCIRVDLFIKRNTKHNLSKHPLFGVLDSMKNRCYNPNNRRYKHYGGKGVVICDSWLKDFQAFYDWAIESGWRKGLTIDRKNNLGNYSPDNCQFITRLENNLNTSRSILWFVNGQKFRSSSCAGKAFGVSMATIQRWCQGYTTTSGNFSPRRENCYSIKKYKECHANNN